MYFKIWFQQSFVRHNRIINYNVSVIIIQASCLFPSLMNYYSVFIITFINELSCKCIIIISVTSISVISTMSQTYINIILILRPIYIKEKCLTRSRMSVRGQTRVKILLAVCKGSVDEQKLDPRSVPLCFHLLVRETSQPNSSWPSNVRQIAKIRWIETQGVGRTG